MSQEDNILKRLEILFDVHFNSFNYITWLNKTPISRFYTLSKAKVSDIPSTAATKIHTTSPIFEEIMYLIHCFVLLYMALPSATAYIEFNLSWVYGIVFDFFPFAQVLDIPSTDGNLANAAKLKVSKFERMKVEMQILALIYVINRVQDVVSPSCTLFIFKPLSVSPCFFGMIS